MKSILTGTLLIATVACASTPAPEAEAPKTEAEPRDTRTVEELPSKSPTAGTLTISDRIRSACGIDDAQAFFPYNSSKLTPAGEALLSKLAECFTSGPLAGETMRLIGHADSRGDDEYNLALGGLRAEAVKTAIARFGLAADKVTTTSRGESEATGTDEAGWEKDRKVEVKVD